ncbi:uncharacterized protein LOC131957896 [Physella acuta]|uniref:uncharacterized protein LOC131957896 n=1 Tax=Physella acuta TaxID=109671 RepID=UPI0027DCD3B7|nr:uncharacterized protein LOC131957896 [Physella acuta]
MMKVQGRQTRVWTQVHRGNSGLRPLLGSFKAVPCNPEEAPSSATLTEYTFDGYEPSRCVSRNTYSERVCSLRLPPTGGPADIDFLRNRLGFCLPMEEQVIRTQRCSLQFLRKYTREAGVGSYGIRSTTRTSTAISKEQSRRESSTKYSTNSGVTGSSKRRSSGYSSTSERVSVKEREKMRLQAKKSSDARRISELEKIVFECEAKSEASSVDQNLNPKMNTVRNIGDIKLIERRMSRQIHLDKIALKAKTSAHHDMRVDDKLMSHHESDSKLTQDVRQAIEISKEFERKNKVRRISQLENVRKKIQLNMSLECLQASTDEDEEEEDEDEGDFIVW